MNVESEVSTETTGRKSYLFRVTTFSRYLAMTLFITLPFLGGWLGYQYAPETVVEVERLIIKEDSPDPANWALPRPVETEKETTDSSPGEFIKRLYEDQTGQTYKVSSTSIRIIVEQAHYGFANEFKTINDLRIEEEIIGLTELPYLQVVGTTTYGLTLSEPCFAGTECGLSGLYRYDTSTKTLREMAISDLFDVVSRASVVSPDGTKALSSDRNYDATEPNSLFLLDFESDTHVVLDTIPVGEGTFCTGGVGGCADLVVDWLSPEKVRLDFFKGGKIETREYMFGH